MATLFVRHKVSDFAKWKAAYDAFDAERSGMGSLAKAFTRPMATPMT